MKVTKKTRILAKPMSLGIGEVTVHGTRGDIDRIEHPEGITGFLIEGDGTKRVNVKTEYPNGTVVNGTFALAPGGMGDALWHTSLYEGPTDQGTMKFTFTPDPSKTEFDQTPVVVTVELHM